MHDEQHLPAVLLSPRGPYRVGDALTASWTMTNFADADVSGARLHVHVPAAADAVLANCTIMGNRGDAVAAAFSRDGLPLGTIRRGDCISAMLDLRFARESAPPQALTMALTLEDGTTFVSEPADLTVRSRALLALTRPPRTYDVDMEARRLAVAFTLENTGEMRAERVDLSAPAPSGFVLSRVRLSTGSAAVTGKEPFRLPDIPRGEELDVVLEFEARGIDLAGHVVIEGMRIAYAGGNLYPEPTTVELTSTGGLGGKLATASTTIEPGSLARIDLTIVNSTSADACGVVAGFSLPPELSYCPGTIAVNGGSDPRRNDPRSIAVGTVLGRSQTHVSLYASVAAPLAHDARLVVGAALDAEPVAPLELTVRSEPAFATAHCSELTGPAVVGTGETRIVRIRAANAGTADAHGVRVRLLSPELVIERAAVVLSSGARETVTMKPTVTRDDIACAAADLGTVGARDIKTLEVELRAPDHFSDGDAFSLRADLRFARGKHVEMGALALTGRCRPAIDAGASGLQPTRFEPMRLGEVRAYTLRVKNAGLAVARGVTVSLNLPGMLAIEAVNGEPARNDVVALREIPAGAAVEVPIALRLVESVDGGAEVTVIPIVSGEAISSVALAPIRIPTAGQAFLDEFAIGLEPRDRDLVATLQFRNVGDATAHHVLVAALDLPNAYVLESTRLGDVPVPDFSGGSLLRRGITLPPLAPGREITLSYRLSEPDADGARVSFVVRSRSQDEIVPDAVVYRSPNTKPAAFDVAPPRMEAPRFVDDFVALDLGRSPNGSRNGHGRHAVTEIALPMPVSEPPPAASETPAHALAATAVATMPQAYGLVGQLTLDPAAAARLRRIAEKALEIAALGTYRHFFAVRALAPRALLGASEAVAAQWVAVHDRVAQDLGAPFDAAARPGFDARMEWAHQFHDAGSGEAAARAIAAIRQAASENVGYDDVPAPDDALRGAIGSDFESYLSSMAEPSGNVLNLILAEAMPTESARDPHLGKALKRYRERLKLLFAALLYQNSNARHERMLSGLDVELDDSLQAIVERLRDVRWA